MQPTFPSSLTKFKPNSSASTSVGSSSLLSLRSAISLCLNMALSSIVTLESTAKILSSEVFRTGLISNNDASIESYAL